MNGIMNENQLTIVKEYEFDNPLITKIDSLIDNSIRDCHHKFFHTFAITVEILFILHVANGIHMLIKNNYMNSNTNTIIIIRILVQILFSENIINE